MINTIVDRGIMWASCDDEAELRSWLAGLPETVTVIHGVHCVGTGNGVRCSAGVTGLPESASLRPGETMRWIASEDASPPPVGFERINTD